MDYIRPIAVACFLWILGKTGGAPSLMDSSSRCIMENGITFAEAQSIQQGNLPDSQQGKCYISCVLKSIGVVDSGGNVSTSGANKLIDTYSTQSTENKEKAKKLLAQCATEAREEKNVCQASYIMERCVLTKRKPDGSALTRNSNSTYVFQLTGLTVPIPLPGINFSLFNLG